MTTITSADQQRIARATLTYLAEPADPVFAGCCRYSARLSWWHPSGPAASPPA